MAETSRSARTVETWWPAILTALTEDVTNARTEGFNRIIKDTKRVGCGYRNRENYRRRILAHIALIEGTGQQQTGPPLGGAKSRFIGPAVLSVGPV